MSLLGFVTKGAMNERLTQSEQLLKYESIMQLSYQDYSDFVADYNATKKQLGVRFGQGFHNYFRLEKCEQHREICDKLWNMDGQRAVDYIWKHFEFV